MTDLAKQSRRRTRRNQRGGGQLTMANLETEKTFIRTKYGVNVYNIAYVKDPETIVFDFSVLSSTTLHNLGKMGEFLVETELRLGDMLFGDCPNITFFRSKLTPQNIEKLSITVTNNPNTTPPSLVMIKLGTEEYTEPSNKSIAQIKNWLVDEKNNIQVNSGAIAAKEAASAVASKAAVMGSQAASKAAAMGSKAATGIKNLFGFSKSTDTANTPVVPGQGGRSRRNKRKSNRRNCLSRRSSRRRRA